MNDLKQRLWRLLERVRALFIADIRRAPHFLSVQLHALALTYVAIYAMSPAFPPEIAAALPSPMRTPVIAGYSALSILFRVIAQKQPNA